MARRPRIGARAVLLVVAAAGALACQLVGSGGTAPAASSGDDPLAAILDRGALRVGLTGEQPPLNMRGRDGALMGLDVELARELADQMDVGVEFVERPFGELLPALEAGQVDLVISSLTITPARNARVAFAGPYLVSGATLIVRAEREEELDERAELDRADRTFSALEGSTGLEAIARRVPKAAVRPAADYEQALGWLLSGEIDGLVADLPFATYVVTTRPEAGLAMLPRPFTTEPLGIALPADAPLFVNLVQNYLNTLDHTGRLMQLKARWLNEGAWVDDVR